MGPQKTDVMVNCKMNRSDVKKSRHRDEAKAFYDEQYVGSHYAAYAEPTKHPFFTVVKALLDKYGGRNGKWLEVGCGRGLLQDVVDDYTGVDLSSAVESFLHKPFCCAPVEALPFEDFIFDGVWSYAVLEHVDNPERALQEMRRVLKPGGILLLAPAWQCRPWASCDYAWKPYRDLGWRERFLKMLIPLRNSVLFRSLRLAPVRLFRFIMYRVCRAPTVFRCGALQPNYSEYRITDADARHSMDPFEAILWFRSRGDLVLSHSGWIQSFLVRTGTLVIQKTGENVTAN